METFNLLSRGGAKFDKQRFSADVQLFGGGPTVSNAGRAKGQSSKILDSFDSVNLPTELDFFKYAAGGASGSSSKGKEKAIPQEDEEMVSGEDDAAKKKRKRSDAGMVHLLGRPTLD